MYDLLLFLAMGRKNPSCGFEVPSFLPFTVMFEKGISFRKKKMEMYANNDEIEQLQGLTKEALLCLYKFYKTKGELVNLNSF